MHAHMHVHTYIRVRMCMYYMYMYIADPLQYLNLDGEIVHDLMIGSIKMKMITQYLAKADKCMQNTDVGQQ